jgi:hypothetical protein
MWVKKTVEVTESETVLVISLEKVLLDENRLGELV